MTTLLKTFLSLLITASLTSCGQSDSQPTTYSQPTTSPILTKYRFVATIDMASQQTLPTAVIGDTVTGTFTFDQAVNDRYPSPAKGNYVQKSPASVQVVIGSNVINSDFNSWLGYEIDVTDNDPDYGGSDTFSWHVNDTTLSTSYGVDYIQVGCILLDSAGKAFASGAMPAMLNSDNFTSKLLFISAVKVGDSTRGWSYRAQITSLEKVQ